MLHKYSSLFFYVPYTLLLIFIPLFFLVLNSYHASTSGLLFLILERGAYQSLLQASISAAISLFLGMSIGLLLIVYGGRWRNTILSLMLVTYVMPGIIMALGILSLFRDRTGLLEIVYGNVVFNAPMVAVLAYSTASSTSYQEVISAKVLGANDMTLLRQFYLKNAFRGALLGGLFSFILCFEGFSLPLIVGGPKFSTLEVYIYLFKRQFPSISSFPFANASYISMIQLITLLLPLLVYMSLRSKSLRKGSGKAYRFRLSWIALPLIMIFLLFIYSPLISMFLSNLVNINSILSIRDRIGVPVSGLILNTLMFSLASTLVAMFLSLFIASRTSRITGLIVMLPMIISPVSVALAFFLAYGAISNSFVLLIIIFSVLVIPITMRMMQQYFETIPPSERFSSRILGDSSFSSIMRMQISRVRLEMATVTSLIFITVMGEFSAIATVFTPSTETLTIGIYQLLSIRDFKGSYSLTEIFVIVIFISAFIINQFGRSDVLGETYS